MTHIKPQRTHHYGVFRKGNLVYCCRVVNPLQAFNVWWDRYSEHQKMPTTLRYSLSKRGHHQYTWIPSYHCEDLLTEHVIIRRLKPTEIP